VVGSSGGVHVNIDICTGRAGLARVEERGHLGLPGAAVHRYTLDRVNGINDSLKKSKNQLHKYLIA